MATGVQVVFDCAEPARLAEFWAGALHYRVQDPPAGFDSWPDFLRARGIPQERWDTASAVVDPDGGGPRIFFQKVPEARTVKNRVHLDLNVGGGPATPLADRRERVDAEAERLAGLGASVVGREEQYGEYWVVMRDPEGNEFCVQ
jgi:hypothetical protein